jgi:hypothetical protein
MESLTQLLIIAELFLIFVVILFKRSSKQNGQTYDGNQVERTTGLPIPLAAHTCSHQWTEVMRETIAGEFEKKVVLVIKCDRCGAIDKTIEEGKIACRHVWRDKTFSIESPFNMRYVSTNYGVSSSAPEPKAQNAWMFKKTNCVVLSCANFNQAACNKLYESIEEGYKLDGTLAHALERMFGYAVRTEGQEVMGI